MRRGRQWCVAAVASLILAVALIGRGVGSAMAQQYPAGAPTVAPGPPAPASAPMVAPAPPAPASAPMVAPAPPASASAPMVAPVPPAPVSSTATGIEVLVTPYLLLGGINSAISTPLPRAPVVHSSVGPFQLLGHLDAVPFMGAIEFRYGPFGLLGNAFHVPVGTDITTRNVFFNGGNASLITNQGTADLLYRWLDQPAQWADVGAGVRAWGFTSDLTLNGGLLPTTSLTRSASWADPLIVMRYHRELGNKFGVTAYGDVGGFGLGAHVDWQVFGTLDYALTPTATLKLGYASLNFNYTAANNLGFNVHMKGPLIAATFRF